MWGLAFKAGRLVAKPIIKKVGEGARAVIKQYKTSAEARRAIKQMERQYSDLARYPIRTQNPWRSSQQGLSYREPPSRIQNGVILDRKRLLDIIDEPKTFEKWVASLFLGGVATAGFLKAITVKMALEDAKTREEPPGRSPGALGGRRPGESPGARGGRIESGTNKKSSSRKKTEYRTGGAIKRKPSTVSKVRKGGAIKRKPSTVSKVRKGGAIKRRKK
jgi:hypothetical protein